MLSVYWSVALFFIALKKNSLFNFRLVFTLKIADVLEFSLGTKVRACGPSSELRETECSGLNCVLAEDVIPNPWYL